MNRTCLWLMVFIGLPAVVGCNAASRILGSGGSYVLTATDAMALPGDTVTLQARLESGTWLRARTGYEIDFYRDDDLFASVRTDVDGVATASFTPPEAGDYHFRVEAASEQLAGSPPTPIGIVVACRPADEPIVVVDLDKTVVASGFHVVLVGDPAPMPDSAAVLRRLAPTRTILYLTHRPDYFGPSSRAWLTRHGYPPGPLLLSSAVGFRKGSGEFKSDMLAELLQRFRGIDVGIGDKVSDAQAYFDNGLRTFLIIQAASDDEAEDLAELADTLDALDPSIEVVTGWDQIEQAIFAGALHSRPQMQQQLRSWVAAAEKRDDEDDD